MLRPRGGVPKFSLTFRGRSMMVFVHPGRRPLLLRTTDTVANVKAKVQEKTGIPSRQQRIYNMMGRCMKARTRLVRNVVMNGDHICVRSPMKVSVTTAGGEITEIRTDGLHTVEDAKIAWMHAVNLPFDREVRLIFGNQQLVNCQPLWTYRIRAGSTLTAVVEGVTDADTG